MGDPRDMFGLTQSRFLVSPLRSLPGVHTMAVSVAFAVLCTPETIDWLGEQERDQCYL